MAYDATKPVTGGSLVAADIRENFRALKEDEIVIAAEISDASISQAKLKTSSGSVSVVCGMGADGLTGNLPGGEYGFVVQTKADSIYINFIGLEDLDLTASYATPGVLFHNIDGKATHTGYAQQRYVTASGEVYWIFILRDNLTKDIYKMWQSNDHPCFFCGGKPLLMPHPFSGYDPITEEIIVINPSENEVLEIREKCIMGEDEPDKDFLEVFEKEYEIDESSNPSWPTKGITVKLPSDKDWRIMPPGTLIKPIKKVITKPDYIIVKNLKKK